MGEDVNDSTDEATTTEQRIVYNKGVKREGKKRREKEKRKGREKKTRVVQVEKRDTVRKRQRGRQGGRVPLNRV